jgi:uncharacterized alpha-E superfamily protein
MLSRVANSIYWMSRYLERAENYARLLGANINLSQDLPHHTENQWKNLLVATRDLGNYHVQYDNIDTDSVLNYMTFESKNPFSIYNSLVFARENARSIKEILPKEVWEHINTFYHEYSNLSKTDISVDNAKIQAVYEQVKMSCHTFFGIVDCTLSRNDAYYFLSLGKFIERADKTSRFLDIGRMHDTSKVKWNVEDLLIWSTVLKSVSALNMYRQQYKNLDRQNILQFLLKDTQFPRSLSFCLFKTLNALEKIGNEQCLSLKIANNLNQYVLDLDLNHFSQKEFFDTLDTFQIENNKLDVAISEDFY